MHKLTEATAAVTDHNATCDVCGFALNQLAGIVCPTGNALQFEVARQTAAARKALTNI